MLPPSINFETPNPAIAFDALNLRVADEPLVLQARRRLAGVSGFGFGGTNVHLVLAQPPVPPPTAAAAASVPPLLLSARSEPALRSLAGRWAELLAGCRLPARRVSCAPRRGPATITASDWPCPIRPIRRWRGRWPTMPPAQATPSLPDKAVRDGPCGLRLFRQWRAMGRDGARRARP